MKSKRFELLMPRHLHEKAKAKADILGISLAEYIKDLIKGDLHETKRG